MLDAAGDFQRRCNQQMVELEALESAEDIDLVLSLIRRHVEYTGSALGRRVLRDWEHQMQRFVKIMPRDYKRVLQAQAKAAAIGRDASFLELVGAANG